MEKKEGFNLEYKREISKIFLKTVSAFANYNNGEIFFGIDDNGKIKGISDVNEDCLRIENLINDTINPVPKFEIEVIEIENKKIIKLSVKKGLLSPYYFQGKTYKRSDTATIEVDKTELNRLILQGLNKDFEELPSQNKLINEKTFTILEKYLKEIIGINKINYDILKTLYLYDNQEKSFNIAGELISDVNNIKFSGIDIIKFGNSINEILYREILENNSIIYYYYKIIEIFKQYYTYERIEGFERKRIEILPEKSFREALANSLVHRSWDINSNIRIAMYNDRIEIISPGKLPEGLSKEEFLKNNISILKNPIIANVFFRLNIIEKFGTGIERIRREYENNILKPEFEINENTIIFKLPIVKRELDNLNIEELEIYEILKSEKRLTRLELEAITKFNKSKIIRIINSLISKNVIDKTGKGRSIAYKIK